MRALRFAFTLLTAACSGSVAPAPVDASVPGDSATDGSSDAADAADVIDAADASPPNCPDFLQNVPGQACPVPQGVECLGNLGASAGWLRCCGGHWTGPNDAGGGLGAPPCP